MLIEKLSKKLVGMYAYYEMLKELYKTYHHVKYELYNVITRRSQRKMKPSKYMTILERMPIAKPKMYQDIWCWEI